MIYPESLLRVYVSVQATDMRKSFNGLSGAVREVIKQDPLSGHVFCFFNRGRTYVKLLFWERDGYCIIAKRLTRGTFLKIRETELTITDLKIILEGGELSAMRRKKRYKYLP